ncbi:putative nuclear matrix constituent protein 1-like protein-like protein, partial [Corchorus olitorius]
MANAAGTRNRILAYSAKITQAFNEEDGKKRKNDLLIQTATKLKVGTLTQLHQGIPPLERDQWIVFWEVIKIRGNQWFGVSLFARNFQGDSCVVAKSIKAINKSIARLLL